MTQQQFFEFSDMETKEKTLTPEDQARFDKLVAEGANLDKDYWIRLNEEGRTQAGDESDPSGDMSQAVAFGSPRRRAQETAVHVMAGQAAVSPDMEFEEAMASVNEGIKVGSKVGAEINLDFSVEGPLGEPFNDAYMRGETLKWLVESSDESAVEMRDAVSSTYSRMAANVASVVDKYYKVSDRWNELATNDKKGYDSDLKRFMGTHQTVTESFLAKVIEKTKGVDERNKFIDVLDGTGFGFVEGIEIDIVNKNGDKKVYLKYEKDLPDGKKFEFSEEITPDLLKEIINDKVNLDQAVSNKIMISQFMCEPQ